MFVAADPENDLPVFPMLGRASRHDMLSFLHTFSAMKSYLPEFHIEKLLLDSAHDAYPLYDYCKTNCINPFIGPNPGHTGYFKYKNDFTIGEYGIPACNWAYVCITVARKKQRTAKNTGVPLPTGKKDASVDIPVLVQSTAEPCISSRRTIQGYLTYRQGIVRNGNWNTTNEPLLNDQISVKK